MKRIKSVVAFLGASGLPVATAKALEVEIFLAFAVLLVGGVFVLGLYADDERDKARNCQMTLAIRGPLKAVG
jgi:hypothetical protein